MPTATMPEEAHHIFDEVTCNTCPFRRSVKIGDHQIWACMGTPPQLIIESLALFPGERPAIMGPQSGPSINYHFGQKAVNHTPEDNGTPCGLHPVVQQRIKKIYKL